MQTIALLRGAAMKGCPWRRILHGECRRDGGALHTAVCHRNRSLRGHFKESPQLFDTATPLRLLGRTQLC